MKKCLSIILCFMVLVGTLLAQGSAVDVSSDYSTSESVHPIEQVVEAPEGYIGIHTPQELYDVRKNLSANFILLSDIDLADYENWEPIGTESAPFTGIFNGNGHTVRNLQIDAQQKKEASYIGLFGFCFDVLHLCIENVTVSAKEIRTLFVGALCGRTSGTILNCRIQKAFISVDGVKGYVGGAVGFVGNNMQEILFDGSIYARSFEECSIGGIAGFSCNSMLQCGASAKIEAESMQTANIGGVVGSETPYCVLKNVYHRGNISGSHITSAVIGGISGFGRDIKNTYHTGIITTTDCAKKQVGGIVGEMTFIQSGFLNLTDSSEFRKYYTVRNSYYNGCNQAVGNQNIFYRLFFMRSVEKRTEAQMSNPHLLCGFDFDSVWYPQGNLPTFQSRNSEFKKRVVLWSGLSTSCFQSGSCLVNAFSEDSTVAFADSSGQIYTSDYALFFRGETTIHFRTVYGDAAEISVCVYSISGVINRLWTNILNAISFNPK